MILLGGWARVAVRRVCVCSVRYRFLGSELGFCIRKPALLWEIWNSRWNESFFSAARRHGADRGARRGRTGEVGGARPRAADRTATQCPRDDPSTGVARPRPRGRARPPVPGRVPPRGGPYFGAFSGVKTTKIAMSFFTWKSVFAAADAHTVRHSCRQALSPKIPRPGSPKSRADFSRRRRSDFQLPFLRARGTNRGVRVAKLRVLPPRRREK